MSNFYLSILISGLIILFFLALFLIFLTAKYKTEINKRKNDGLHLNNNLLNLQRELKVIEKSKSINTGAFFNKELLDELFKNEKLSEAKYSAFFKKLERQFETNESYKNVFNFVVDKFADGKKSKSKFAMTLEEFKSNQGWMIVMSLLACSQIDDISNSEKESWFANFGPLKNLFFNESKKNYLNNTWLVFEKKIEVCNLNNVLLYRPDLILATKTEDSYNLVILELKQWSEYWNQDILDEKIKKINNQVDKYKKIINDNKTSIKLNVLSISFLFNSTAEQINEFNREKTYKKHYSFDDRKELSQRIFMHLTKGSNIDNFSFEELNKVLQNIEKI